MSIRPQYGIPNFGLLTAEIIGNQLRLPWLPQHSQPIPSLRSESALHCHHSHSADLRLHHSALVLCFVNKTGRPSPSRNPRHSLTATRAKPTGQLGAFRLTSAHRCSSILNSILPIAHSTHPSPRLFQSDHITPHLTPTRQASPQPIAHFFQGRLPWRVLSHQLLPLAHHICSFPLS